MSKSLIRYILRENLNQADKVYFKSGKLSPEDRQLVLSVTNGDNYTRLVSDWLFHLTKIWQEKTNAPSTHKFLKDFYTYLKNYDKNVLPVDKNLEDYTALTDERGGHILDLFSCLKNRQQAVDNLNTLPSIAKRNLKNIIRKPESEYGFKILNDKFVSLKNNLKILPNNEEKRQMVLNKIFSSKNSLDHMVDMSSHYANAFNTRSEDTSKEELIDNLDSVDADIIQNSGDILVIKVNDYESMQHIGCTSMWCFSQPNSEGFWNDYANLGYVFIIFDFSKEYDDATFMMTYLPDSGSVYASTNVPIEDLGINDDHKYLKDIGVDLQKLNSDYKLKKEPVKQQVTDPNQLSLFEIKQKLRENLLQEVKKPYLMYHGTSHDISKFSDDFVGGKDAVDQEGPGIYFTSSLNTAMAYGDKVYKVEISPKKSVSKKENTSAPVKELEWLIRQSSDWQDTAMNWHENPNIGIRMALKDMVDYRDNPQDQFTQIWFDFYRHKPIEYVRNMVKLGYDSVIIDGLHDSTDTNIVHIVVLDPSIIKYLGLVTN